MYVHSKWVHVIKATKYTRLKATPKYTGKKATKIYRNIGYNEYTRLKATAFLNIQEKRLHFVNILEKRLHFLSIQEKATLFEYTRKRHSKFYILVWSKILSWFKDDE